MCDVRGRPEDLKVAPRSLREAVLPVVESLAARRAQIEEELKHFVGLPYSLGV